MSENIANDLVAEAKDYFAQKYNCSQSTFAPFAKYYGMDLDLAFKIAAPFGGGFGHMGGGLWCGQRCFDGPGTCQGQRPWWTGEKKHACYHLAAEFQEKFKAEHGSVLCPKLLGLDIGDPDQLQEARDRNLFAEVCPNYIETAVRLMVDILELGE